MADPINLNTKPYYDDFDSSKQYVQLLGMPGRVEQSRDFTQLQTLLKYFLKNLSDSLMKNGDIQSGMDYHWNGNQLTVDDGKVYLDGLVQDFKQQAITLTKSGNEQVGVKTVAYIIDETMDSSLYDPATGQANYGQPGTNRLKFVPTLTLNDSTASTIYTFQDGNLLVQVTKPNDSTLNDILAKRQYDTNGNYLVNGLTLKVDSYDANNVQITVEAGTAYVQGYQIIKPVPTKVLVPISTSYQTQTAEPKLFVQGTVNYPLNNTPAKQIDQIIAQVQSTANMTKGSGSIDYLPHTSDVSIVSITAGSTTYVNGTDYSLSDDGVNWLSGGQTPAVGGTYTCVYIYNKTMINGTDYKLASITDQWGTTTSNVQFLSGDVPVNNTTFNVTYDYYLARIDAVSMDKGGNIIITTGTPALSRSVYAPTIDENSLLPLGNVSLPPDSLTGTVQFNTITRLTMNDLQSMEKRLELVEYNQAIDESDREAMAGEDPSTLMGVFSDNFTSSTKGDLTNALFTAMYDLDNGRIMLPYESESDITPEIDLPNSSATVYSSLISSPMTESVIINQPYATTTWLVNPYLAFNTLASITLDPAKDNWIDTEKITIQNVQTKAMYFYRWFAHSDGSAYKASDQKLFGNMKIIDGQNIVNQWRPYLGQTSLAMTTSNSLSEVDTAETYMRQRTITVTGHNFQANADNLQLYFDDILCPLTPGTGYSGGTNAGTVRANASGDVVATFTNPANVRTGTREVILKNASNTASTTYTAIGTQQTIIDTVLTTYITVTAVDPLAQSFEFDQDTIISSIGLFFSSKGTTDNVTVQIRNVNAGVPGNIVYRQVILTPSQINLSTDSTAETKVTFPDPVYCNAGTYYAIVVEAGTDKPGLFTCHLGGTDISTGTVITNTPYLAGEMYSSKNADAWNPQPEDLLKFKIYQANFADTGTVQFQPMTNVSADRLVMLADYLTPQNTGCYWEVNVNGQGFQPITTYQELDLQYMASTIVLRATFKSNTEISPLLTQESFTLMGFLTAQSGTYISRNTQTNYDYTTVKQSIVAYVPQGATVTPQFSYDNGATWITPTLQGTTSVDSTQTQYNYQASVAAATHARNFRARVNLSANTPFLRPFCSKLYDIMT